MGAGHGEIQQERKKETDDCGNHNVISRRFEAVWSQHNKHSADEAEHHPVMNLLNPPQLPLKKMKEHGSCK